MSKLLSTKTYSPFYFEKDFIKIISGQEEAFYGWITVNFLKGVFSQKISGGTYGALDLGGASTQNTFRVREIAVFLDYEHIFSGLALFQRHSHLSMLIYQR